MTFALHASAALVPNKVVVRQRNNAPVAPRGALVTVAGTGRGFGRHTHKKDTKMSIDYAKHVPGYNQMSRPQKYRARKHVKQMMNRMEHDQMQQKAVKNTSDFAKKAFAFFQECVDLCEEPECVQECKVEWDF